jgi:5'-3' exonuclease
MGIPSYFSYIIKNYSNIIRNLVSLQRDGIQFHHLFMDCNSIIYDVVRDIEEENGPSLSIRDYEDKIITFTIERICDHVDYIKPLSTVFIAFDGVAPFAKMEQQRSRRNKGAFLSKATPFVEHYGETQYSEGTSSPMRWSTSTITPGTQFMQTLSDRITDFFLHDFAVKHSAIQVVVSTSNECGEGEHKMFQYMREQTFGLHENTIVYGLDSDLIMLSIFHCKLFRNIYIFRESPAFMSSLVDTSIIDLSHSCYFMDIASLSTSILSEMKCGHMETHRIYDYVFLCFFLGNDFLPHFPALNIRTNGFSILLSTYREYIGNYANRHFISLDLKIQWKWVQLFVQELAKHERDFLIAEYNLREKWDTKKWHSTNAKERDFIFQSIPIMYRHEEMYICPSEKHWETRYYQSLFCEKGHSTSDICVQYLEGLEWTFKYYTMNCPDWRWRYQSHYAPLLSDLCNYIPRTVHTFIQANQHRPYSPSTQLAYVLPRSQHGLLPSHIQDVLSKSYMDYYPETYRFKWAFCRYFWEAHVVLPDIPMNVLDDLEKYADIRK